MISNDPEEPYPKDWEGETNLHLLKVNWFDKHGTRMYVQRFALLHDTTLSDGIISSNLTGPTKR